MPLKKTSSSVVRGEITYRPDKKVCAQPKPNTKTIARLVSPVRPNTRRKASTSPSAKERKKRSQQHPPKSNSTLSEGPKRKVRKTHPPTHPATHQTLCCTGVPARPDCYLPNRARLPKRQWAPVPEQHHQRSISTPGVNRPNRPTYAFTVHTRGGGGGGAGDEGSGVNHRISRSRSGRRGRAGGRAGERAGLSLRVSVFSLLGSRSSQFCNDSLVVNNNAIGSPAGF